MGNDDKLPEEIDDNKIGADGESELPEEIIQHIQSLILSERDGERDAARTSLLSKSWHSAWSTRPNLSFDETKFRNRVDEFTIFTKKTMQRYEDLNRNIKSFKLWILVGNNDSLAKVRILKAIFRKKTIQRYAYLIRKIKSFKLWMQGNDNYDLARELILKAIKLGAIDLTIEFSNSHTRSLFVLPDEVLESETLVTLSVSGLTIDLERRNKAVACSNLKFLSLFHTRVRGDLIRDLISRCPSIEELTLFYASLFGYDYDDEFHNLKCLRLFNLATNYDQLWNKSPCLKELVICNDNSDYIRICSPSLERITIIHSRIRIWNGEFDVPNIQNIKISSGCSFDAPRLKIKIKGTHMEWEIKRNSDTFWEIKGSDDFMKTHRLSGFSLSVA